MADFAAVTPSGSEAQRFGICVADFAAVIPNGSEARRFGVCVVAPATVIPNGSEARRFGVHAWLILQPFLLKGLGPAPFPFLVFTLREVFRLIPAFYLGSSVGLMLLVALELGHSLGTSPTILGLGPVDWLTRAP